MAVCRRGSSLVDPRPRSFRKESLLSTKTIEQQAFKPNRSEDEEMDYAMVLSLAMKDAEEERYGKIREFDDKDQKDDEDNNKIKDEDEDD
ncbi:MAG: hypothetical protein M1817_000893 [Caeruleum heppii]|nr:MAG: hypothetical protein M1817_000893 [Caeruleum heppii]